MIRLESEYTSTSKIKIIGFIILSLIFVFLSFRIIISPSTLSSIHSPFRQVITLVACYISIPFFGLGSVIFIFQLFGYSLRINRLTIDNKGITDKFRVGSFGHIPWQDISDLKICNFQSKSYLVIVVYNPAKYINRQRSLSGRKDLELRYEMTGSPIHISKDFLGQNLNKLKSKIETKLKGHS